MRTLLVPVLLLAAPLAAQSPAPVDPARLQVARQLVTTMNIAATMDSAMTAMMTLQRSAQRELPPFVFDSLMAAMRRGVPVQQIHDLSKIDCWFLNKLQGIVDQERALAEAKPLDPELLWNAKRFGFSDAQIGALRGETAAAIRERASVRLSANEQAARDETIRACRSAMDAAAFDAAWTAGHTLTLAQAVTLALQPLELVTV